MIFIKRSVFFLAEGSVSKPFFSLQIYFRLAFATSYKNLFNECLHVDKKILSSLESNCDAKNEPTEEEILGSIHSIRKSMIKERLQESAFTVYKVSICS